MAAKKKILASEVYVCSAVEASLLSLAEQTKATAAIVGSLAEPARVNDVRCAALLERIDVTQREINTIVQAMMAMAQRMDARLGALEGAARAGA
jgi:hypothetical protein